MLIDGKAADGAFVMRFPTAPDALVPHLDVNADMGAFVYAVAKLPPEKSYMAEGTTCNWSEYMRLWSKVTGHPARYEQVSLQQMIDESPDKEFGREVGDMFLYSSAPGYDGGDKTLLTSGDIIKVHFFPKMRPRILSTSHIAWHRMPNDKLGGLDEEGELVICSLQVRSVRLQEGSGHFNEFSVDLNDLDSSRIADKER